MAKRALEEVKKLDEICRDAKEVAQDLLGKQKAAYLIGTCWPEMTYGKIAKLVGISRQTLLEWRKDREFAERVEKYADEVGRKYWPAMKRAQIRRALWGDTRAFEAMARVEGKITDRHKVEVDQEAFRGLAPLTKMTDVELEAYIAKLKAERGQADSQEREQAGSQEEKGV